MLTYKVDLSRYNNDFYYPGRNFLIRAIWYLINALFFKTSILPFYIIKRNVLILFGAKIGSNFIIKPCVNIKYPWKLNIGNNVWIGEGVWIDNLCNITIYDNVCISQGAMLLTGNHNYKKRNFDLFIGEIIIEDGVWIGAKSIVCPGVKCFSHSVLSVGSVANKNLSEFCIYNGNPAEFHKKRIIV